MNNDLSKHESLFYNNGYQLAKEALTNGYNEKALFRSIKKMFLFMDQFIDSLLNMAKKQSTAVQCKEGCHWCCHQAIFANTYELDYLKNHIKTHFNKEEAQHILNLAKAKNKLISTLNEKETLQHKSPCPLLENNICSIYQARPMACRIYLSSNLSSCIEFYHNPTSTTNFPALFDFPLQAGRYMNEGFCAALAEIGIQTTEYRIEEGLCIKP